MEPNASGRTAVEELPVDRAREEIESGGVILLDTREPHEHSAAHIEGCILIPPAMVVDNVEQQIPDRSARVIVYCAAGMRSEAAARQMVEMGYEDVVNMTFAVGGTEVAVILVGQIGGGFKISYRSRCNVDCARLAEQFGGGGHKAAAGAFLDEPLESAQRKVLDAVRAQM